MEKRMKVSMDKKKLFLIDIANCEDMSIKTKRSINIYGFPIGIMSLATYLRTKLDIEIDILDFGINYNSEQELVDIVRKGLAL